VSGWRRSLASAQIVRFVRVRSNVNERKPHDRPLRVFVSAAVTYCCIQPDAADGVTAVVILDSNDFSLINRE